MRKKSKSRRSTPLRAVGFIGGAIGVIGVSIVVTLYVSGEIDFNFSGSDKDENGGYRNVTHTDAQLSCEAEAKDEFGERLRLLTPDAHSSRFDEKANRYKLFFHADLYPGNERGNVSQRHFVNCFVHGSRGTVVNFESMPEKEVGAKPIRESDSNVFGF
ncbi:hypothetical protein [Aurantivibrio infirmus]